jgi:hypothetical protein
LVTCGTIRCCTGVMTSSFSLGRLGSANDWSVPLLRAWVSAASAHPRPCYPQF